MLLPILLVIASGMAHAVWSLFTKKSRSKSVFLWSIMMISTLLLLPVLIIELWRSPLSVSAYGLLLLSVVLQGLYAWLLSRTYELGDLSQIYPIMRGTSTLLVPVIGIVALGESLTPVGWAGILCMLAGFIILGSSGGVRNHPSATALTQAKPILMALSVGLCTTCYVFVDKLNLQHLSPLALLEVTNIGFVLGLTPAVLSSPRIREEWQANRNTLLLGAILNPGSYLLFLFAMQQAPIAHISPLREIGTVFAALLGIVLLKEQQGLKRISSSVVIFCGIVLLGVFG
ncbi:DMT family transporter [Paenibacillus agri]|uniref:EamA family transporter n=1 Tax=Paenibacillus agri TaxID=2744309 RepID=A0A850EXV7_9BACL|nr:DMT family transporter [Paenibacillus agri]NUU63732.1 EamA family transporter [Paenibacillus agri]